MVKLDEVLEEVYSFLHFDLVHFEQVLQRKAKESRKTEENNRYCMTSPSLSSSSSSRRTLRHSQTAERSSLHFLGLPGVFSWPLNLILFRHPGQYHLGWLYSELILIGSLTASLDSLQRKFVFTAFFLSPLYQHIHRIHPPLLLYSWPTKNHEKHRLSWRSAPDEAKKATNPENHQTGKLLKRIRHRPLSTKSSTSYKICADWSRQ